ncbi:hypothetical protein D9758_015312 [Tetrapyrgos nigripes]|uniref:Xylanolytic transcriptional activator regulatory domain-containing protein n=1 Tax=Tetrapyrgos nigripes TaxID=182062 RepID=A0A8H5CEA0_9AGAR|nr:hypothetical protein D9758_015312 [Tetrapyrgos nigripes]
MSDEEVKSRYGSHKKRRLQNACDECRKRKGDSATMPGNRCTHCISLDIDCTHVLATIKKKRGPPIGKPRGSKSIRSTVSAILSTTKPFEAPDTPEAVLELFKDLATYVRKLEEELDELQQTLMANTAEASSERHDRSSKPIPAFPFWSQQNVLSGETLEQDARSLEGLSDQLKRLVLDQSLKRHFGTSSSLTLVRNAMDNVHIPQDVQCPSSDSALYLKARRPEFWAIYPVSVSIDVGSPVFPEMVIHINHAYQWQIPPQEDLKPLIFPETDLMKKLIDLYFVNFNQYLPVLHRPTFDRSIAEDMHLRNRNFGCVLLGVCALGSRYCDDPATLESEAPEFSAGWKYFRQIRPIPITYSAAPSLYQLQIICISIFFLQATSTPESVWVQVAVGIRLAQEVGAHRRMPGQKPTIEGELWKRVFWVLYACDIYVSAFLGRPRATSSDDFDIDLPVQCNDEYWEHSDPELAFKQPPGRPSNLVYFVTFLRLLDILNMAQKTIYLTRHSDTWTMMGISDLEWSQRMVSELDSMLNNWIDTIPEHLKWDPNREDIDFFHQSVSLYVTYYWIQILVHKPFIPRLGATSEVAFPSMAICANAARSACHVMEVQQRRGFLPLPNVLVTLYNAAIVLILNAWRGKHLRTTPGTNKELIDVYKCIGMIRSYEGRWQSAGTYCDIIREILSISNLYNPESVDPGCLKRSRDSKDDSSTGGQQPAFSLTSNSSSSSSSSPSSSSPGEPRKIAGTHRVSASASRQSTSGNETGNILPSTSASASSTISSMTLPHQDTSHGTTLLNIDPIFNLPLRSNELGSLPLHESFDPFGDAQAFVNSSDIWMTELFHTGGEESQVPVTGIGAGGDGNSVNNLLSGLGFGHWRPEPSYSNLNNQDPSGTSNNMVQNQGPVELPSTTSNPSLGSMAPGYSQTVMASLFPAMGSGPSTQNLNLPSQQMGQTMFVDSGTSATHSDPTTMSSSDWDAYIANVDDLLRSFMSQ